MIKTKFTKYKNISYFTLSSITLNASSLLAGLITYRYVDPYYMGLWQTLILFETYSFFLRLGIISGMSRELPFNIGQGNSILANEYAETTLFFTLINIAFFISVAIIVLFFISIQDDWIFPLFAILLITSTNFYNTYLLATFRANSDFNRLSNIQFVQSFIKIASILLVIYIGFKGFVIREILLVFAVGMLAHLFRPMKSIKPRWNKSIFIRLLKIGLPIFISSYMIMFLNTAPRLILLRYGSVSMLGIYAPLLTIITAVSVFQQSITTYLYPKMSYALGKTNNRILIWRKALFSHLGLFILGIPVVIVCYFGIPLLIDSFLPKYIESKPIISIGVFIALFMSYKFGYTTLITLKAWKLVLIYILAFAILQFSLPIILMEIMPVLLAVVYGQLVAAALMVLISLLTNYLATHDNSFLSFIGIKIKPK